MPGAVDHHRLDARAGIGRQPLDEPLLGGTALVVQVPHGR
jgi:hypothetical protein